MSAPMRAGPQGMHPASSSPVRWLAELYGRILVTIGPKSLKSGRSELRCAVSVNYTPDFET